MDNNMTTRFIFEWFMKFIMEYNYEEEQRYAVHSSQPGHASIETMTSASPAVVALFLCSAVIEAVNRAESLRMRWASE